MSVPQLTFIGDVAKALTYPKNSEYNVLEYVDDGNEYEFYFVDGFDLDLEIPVYSGINHVQLTWVGELGFALNHTIYSDYTKNGGYFLIYIAAGDKVKTIVRRPSRNPL